MGIRHGRNDPSAFLGRGYSSIFCHEKLRVSIVSLFAKLHTAAGDILSKVIFQKQKFRVGRALENALPIGQNVFVNVNVRGEVR